MTDQRIVSLIASATEIVCALGLEDQLVGRSHECDFPPSVRALPVCSETRIDTTLSSKAIDDQVKAVLREALSVYKVRVEQLERLQPTRIITQSQCDVCAVSLADVQQAVCQMVSSKPEVISLEPMQLSDIWRDIRIVADAGDVSRRADVLISDLQARLNHIEKRVAQQGRPTVACIEWIDPLMSAGNWIPELVKIAGGENLFGMAGEHSPWMTWDDLHNADPDVIVVLPCGFDLQRTYQELDALIPHPAWHELQAVRNEQVFLTDGNQYFNRPGPRVVESAEILTEILHPQCCPFGHQGTGWQRLCDLATRH